MSNLMSMYEFIYNNLNSLLMVTSLIYLHTSSTYIYIYILYTNHANHKLTICPMPSQLLTRPNTLTVLLEYINLQPQSQKQYKKFRSCLSLAYTTLY